jgi:carbon monoxide dehydrogenase subunit G
MIVVERRFAVLAAPGAVLSYLRDFGNARDWDPSAQRTSRIDAGPLAPGAHWRHLRKFFGVTAELTYTLLAAEEDRLVLHGRSEGATCTDTVVVRALPPGAEVHYRVELEVHGLAKLATPLVRTECEKLATESVAALTAALEGVPRRRLGAPLPSRLAEETG